MRKSIVLLLCMFMISALAAPALSVASPQLSTAQELADYLKTKMDASGDPAKIKLADAGSTVQVSTPVTLNESFAVPSGIKLQSFVQMSIQSAIVVYGKLQDSRALEFRRNGIVGTGAGSIVLQAGSSYYQQGVEVVGANGYFMLGTNASVTLKAENGFLITSGTVTVPAGKTVTADMAKSILVADGATLVVNGTIAEGIVQSTTPPGQADLTALNQAIAGANTNRASVSVSEDGTDITAPGMWVSQAVMDQYESAIVAATAVRDQAGVSQLEADSAVTQLASASSSFDAARQQGTGNGVIRIATASELVAMLQALTIDDSKVKLNGNTAELYEPVVLDKEMSIASGVKLQLFAQATVNASLDIYGIVQDSRAAELRTGGLIGTGTGKVNFYTGSSYYQQGTEVIGAGGIFRLGADTRVAVRGNHHLDLAAGMITLAKPVTSQVFAKITVSDEATFNFSIANIGEGVAYFPAGLNKVQLTEALAIAEAHRDYTGSSIDGQDIGSDTLWVTPAAKEEYAASIQRAAAVRMDSDSTEADYGNARTELEAATTQFVAAKGAGGLPVAEMTTAGQLLSAIQAFQTGGEEVVRALNNEVVNGITYQVIEVFKPVTITKNMTVPANVRLKYTAQMTVHGVITVKGQLQDFRDEGFIIGNGAVGAGGIGAVQFMPGSALYIKGKGEAIGPTGLLALDADSVLTLYAKSRLELSQGSAQVLKPLIVALTTDATIAEGTTLTVIASIPKEINVVSYGKLIDASIQNTEAKLGLVATVAASSDEGVVTAELQEGRIYLTAGAAGSGQARVTLTSADGKTAYMDVIAASGAIIDKMVVKYGALSASELKTLISTRTTELEELIIQAESRNLDAEREKGTVWFAKEYDKYADWDEQNMAVNKRMFAVIPTYSPGGRSPEELAAELPEFERTEIIAMLETAIAELSEVLDGSVTRRPVRLVDWDGVTLQGSNFYSNGKPVFLHDYFSKPLDVSKDNTTLYNHYLGSIDLPRSINPSFVSDSNGTPTSDKYGDLQNRPTSNMGYTILWHDPAPAWAVSQNGDTMRDGITTFTKYDINHPAIRSIWKDVLANTGPITSGKPYTELGYLLANEPHWFLEKGHWAVAKKANGQEGISDIALQQFADWLQDRHGTIDVVNALWGTSFISFDAAAKCVIPLDKSYKGTPAGYDVSLFNMERGTEWLTFLHDEVKANDPDANTHMKLMPDLFAEGNRTHGINFEDLTELAEIIGDDAKTRKVNFKATGSSEDWTEHYAYYWKELGMSYDFMHSVSPEKAHVNSEVHFLSTVAYRDLYMKPEYVRSTYWLATVLGMDAGFTWYWGRNPDGSIENRLMNTTVQGLLESYPGTVAQQPRVANELSKTMMDLNAFSEEIVQFQTQEKPIRIFYSETSAIQDEHYMDDQFELYEALNFDGVPIGFATESIIKKQPNSAWDVIVVRETPNVTDAEFAALQSYLDAGGTIIIDGESLAFNEYRQPRTASLAAGNGTLIAMNGDVTAMADEALDMLGAANKLSPVELKESNGLTQKGAIWRVVQASDHSYVMTIINVGKNNAELEIAMADQSPVTITDMMTGKEMAADFVLPSEGVLLLEVQVHEKEQPTAPNHPATPAPPVSTLDPEVEVISNPQAVDGVIKWSVPANKNKVLLPAQSFGAQSQSKLQLLADGLAIDIPASVLKDLTSKVELAAREGAFVAVSFDKLTESRAQSLVAAAMAAGSVQLTAATPIIDFTLSIVDQSGKEIKLPSFKEPITISLRLNEGTAKLSQLGMYFMKEDGTLEYVGGSVRDGMLVAAVRHFSTYAGLQYKKTFKDVPADYWAAPAIELLAARGIVTGVSADEFQPKRSVTRAEFAALLVRALGLNAEKDQAVPFIDVDASDWYAYPVRVAYENGLVTGKSTDRFAPDDIITRQEVAAVLMRAKSKLSPDHDETKNDAVDVIDLMQASDWAQQAIRDMLKLGWMQGRGDSRFAPLEDTKREEVVQVIVRMLAI
ncbi:S-layer homology domain-containing protein [Paenibacillus sp. strain BS8-2]